MLCSQGEVLSRKFMVEGITAGADTNSYFLVLSKQIMCYCLLFLIFFTLLGCTMLNKIIFVLFLFSVC